jgi:osmotically-inducible protein OsmY
MAEQLVATPERFEREADRRLFLELRSRLWEYEPLRATHPRFDLNVRHGTVRLSGRVRTLAMKRIADYICQRTPGVAVVVNELVSDTELTRNVADALASDPELGPLCLRIDARDGIAILNGDLPRAELETRAVELAQGAAGVVAVESELTVRPVLRPPTAPLPKSQDAEAAAATSTGKAGS